VIKITRTELPFFFTDKFCNIKTEKDITIRQRVEDHLIDAINNGMNPHNILFIALEGSQNYGLDIKTSDVDTKLIVLPTVDDVIYGRKLVSSTAVRENEEHTNYSDIRFFFPTLKRQNINFIEILFSKWILVNREYEDELAPLFENRELIARYNEVKAVKTIGGIATDRYKAIQNLNSKRADIIRAYGYDGKAVSHLIRLDNFLQDYISKKSYQECLMCGLRNANLIKGVKQNKISKETALKLAESEYKCIQKQVDNFVKENEETINPEVDKILDTIQRNIIKKDLSII
jgi:predicted nucleotidyltransferase